jgi:hypothetical protein
VGCGGGSATTSTSASKWQQLSPKEKQQATDQVAAIALLKGFPQKPLKEICAPLVGRLPNGQRLRLIDQARLLDKSYHALVAVLGPKIRQGGGQVKDTVQRFEAAACGVGKYKRLGPYWNPTDRTSDPRFG